jgi:hypothetical protein
MISTSTQTSGGGARPAAPHTTTLTMLYELTGRGRAGWRDGGKRVRVATRQPLLCTPPGRDHARTWADAPDAQAILAHRPRSRQRIVGNGHDYNQTIYSRKTEKGAVVPLRTLVRTWQDLIHLAWF